MFCRRGQLLATTVILAAACASSGEAGSITFNSMMADEGDQFWQNYTYISRDVVKSLNEASSALAVKGHEALDLGQRGPLSRLGYMLTAGQVAARFQWANSLVIGHEGAHFQNHHRFGFEDHHFRSRETGEVISFQDAYLNTFLYGDPGGPATSVVGPNADLDHHSSHGIEATTAGVNWQMAYSEDWIKDATHRGRKTSFDTGDFYVNRYYLTMYAFGDLYRYKDSGDTSGDLYKFAKHLSPSEPAEETLRDISVYGLAANLLSPLNWQTVSSLNNYVSVGKTDFEAKFYQTRFGGVLWDIPQYIVKDAFTLAPTLYFNANRGASDWLGANNLLLSASYETAVIGETDAEMRLAVTGTWGDLEADLGVSSNGDGSFVEGEAHYNFSDSFAVNAGASLSDGKTLRGTRNMPTGDNAAWVGVRFSF